MIEAQRVASFVFDTLLADTAAGGVAALLGNRIYRDRVPASAVLPAATVTVVSGTDAVTLGGNRVLSMVLVDVRVVGDGSSYGPINAAADRVDAVLSNRGGLKNGADVVELRRDQVQAFIEDDPAGKTYAHLIQTFRSEAFAYP